MTPALNYIFKNQKLILGISGGIAIYKTCELARVLTKSGVSVDVVMTNTAKKMIAPEVFTALTGTKTWHDNWQENSAGEMAHIALSRDRAAILVAPTTANLIAKIANGAANDLLSTLIIARPNNCQLILAPAMNKEMWVNNALQRNLTQCQTDGINIIPPQTGDLACGEIGIGRMNESADLLLLTARYLAEKPLLNKTVLITVGPTYEKVDPVRGITNVSSGKMGTALAKAAWLLGAKVSVVAGGNIKPFIEPQNDPLGNLDWQNVESAQDMHDSVLQKTKAISYSAFIATAAVADYKVLKPATQKIKKEQNADDMSISLTRNPDILKTVSALKTKRPKVVIGFAAESENIVAYAQSKLVNKKLDYIVANDVSVAFNSDDNSGYLLNAKVDKAGKNAKALILKKQPKELMAFQIFKSINL